MIQEIVNEIVAAEAEAEQIVKDALAEAREVNLNAEAERTAMIAAAKESVKEERKKIIASAEQEGEERYREILEIGQKAGEELIRNTETTKQAKAIAEAFRARYVER